MSRKSKIRYGGLIFRTLAVFIFIAFSISLPSVSIAQEGKWTTKADMPTPRRWLSTSVVDGKIYAIGGWNGVKGSPSHSAVEEYDPETDTWTKKADMPTARSYLSASAVDGKIYAIGGWTRANTTSSVEVYDPETNTWTKKADMPMPTYNHAASVVNGKIYVMGGEGGSWAVETILSTILKYNPATDTWTKEGDMRVPRTAMSASVVDGRIYVIGGKEVGVRKISTVEAYQPEPYPADGAESVDLNVELSWTAGLGAGLHTVYFGDNLDDVNNAAGGLPQGTLTYTPGPLEFAKTYYWRVDELEGGRGVETHKGDVWSFTTQGAVGSPSPSNGAVDVKQTPVLSWNPGVLAASHEVYFGTDEEAVKNATTTSPEYQGTRALGDEILDPGKLAFDTTYFWRVDEVNNTNPDSPWVGNVWSFTTVDFIVVDDFEDYDIGNNEIWWAWKDGAGYASHPTGPPYAGNGTGSMVGDESTGSYMEETIVHGGSQAMPLFFDNSVLKYSEVEMTLTYPRDWSEKGVSALSIWFRGDWNLRTFVSSNDAEPMYVALNGNAVVYHDNPDAAQITTWTEWTIDLQVFADLGVDLTNVNTIALGFGDRNNPQPGGRGLMYFDDIRLYRPRNAPEE